MSSDLVSIHLDVIARLLESRGYVIEVDYSDATIIVWLENWPVIVKVKRTVEKEKHDDSICD